MAPVYVAYYTTGTPYEREADALRESLDAFGLPLDVSGVPTLGSWVENCAQKPAVIAAARARHPGKPVVYLDADARVRSRPTLFDEIPADVDLAVHYRDGTELLSGTLYLGATEGADAIVAAWRDACRNESGVWDQRHLQRILNARHNWRIERLPASYCLIFDLMRHQGPPVIEHTQASRRWKHVV